MPQICIVSKQYYEHAEELCQRSCHHPVPNVPKPLRNGPQTESVLAATLVESE